MSGEGAVNGAILQSQEESSRGSVAVEGIF